MTAAHFVIAELERFIVQFPSTRVRYENHECSDTHFVEVLPNETYRSDATYIQWERDFFVAFVSRYPAQNICFISDDALVGLDHVDWEGTGTAFSSKPPKQSFGAQQRSRILRERRPSVERKLTDLSWLPTDPRRREG